MLRDSDFDLFVELVRRAECSTQPPSEARPGATLRAERKSDDRLHRNELTRLKRSLKIAYVAGDIPESPHRLLDAIVQDSSPEVRSYRPLTHSEAWLDALRWAISHPQPSVPDYLPHQGQDRQFVVGEACKELRRRGYRVDIGAGGPQLGDDTRTEIARSIDSLIADIGGVDAICRLCGIISQHGKVHDGMWLLGNLPCRPDQPPIPWVPVGWLLSIALRHIRREPSTDDPGRAWNAALQLAIAFAASMDCQRYNQFDGVFLEAPDFVPTLAESLAWRELFTLPQVPPSELSILRDAFSQIPWPQETDDLARDVDRLFAELDELISGLSVDRLTAMPQWAARSAFPLLWEHARAPGTGVNARYLDPFGAHPRDHDRYVFFDGPDEHVSVLPSPLAAASACEAIFRLIWKKAKCAASDIVGDTVEKSVAIACGMHSASVWEQEFYRADGTELEIDVAVRDGNEIVLFETKAKSLRRVSRTGDIMAFIEDFTDSFIALLKQLVRHDHNIKRGFTPLTADGENPDELRVTKVAVSTLSYGPVSDHILSNRLFLSIVEARLGSAGDNAKHREILDAFNDTIDQIMEDIVQVAPREQGQLDLFAYMLHVFWLDLGQLFYVLRRGRSVPDGLSALRHVTFSTQDFWTEMALADRTPLTEKHWHPPSGHADDD